jgi:predicted transcriptional regulator of viral defense system
LKKQNPEYKKALVLFKEKLNEVAVFNANLAYATRLFTEHSTTKQEKLNILKRFDSVSTMNESKNLFNTIKSELDVKNPVTESVAKRISSTPQSSSSQQVLSESKAYENPQFKRMKDLMGKLK